MTASEFSNQLVKMENKLSHFALSLTANKDDGKDLLQDTYLKALTNIEKFQESTNLYAWTHTIMRNTFINNYRKNVRQNTTFDNTKDSSLFNQTKDMFNAEPDSILREKEITSAIDRLDKEFKDPFKMCIQGYKYKEIAEVLGVTIGTIKSRIFFTRKKLGRVLSDYKI